MRTRIASLLLGFVKSAILVKSGSRGLSALLRRCSCQGDQRDCSHEADKRSGHPMATRTKKHLGGMGAAGRLQSKISLILRFERRVFRSSISRFTCAAMARLRILSGLALFEAPWRAAIAVACEGAELVFR